MLRIRRQKELPPAEDSIKSIEDILLDMDITKVTKELDGDSVTSLTFDLIFNKKNFTIRLPVFVDVILKTMKDDYKQITKKDKFDLKEQAERVCFYNLAEHIGMISTMVKLKQITLIEGFLPFVYDGVKDQTFYEVLESGNMKFIDNK